MVKHPTAKRKMDSVNEKFEILRAGLVPVEIIVVRSVHVAHTNIWKFLLRDAVWAEEGVRDVTEELRTAAEKF
jgi:hypothetical protein